MRRKARDVMADERWGIYRWYRYISFVELLTLQQYRRLDISVYLPLFSVIVGAKGISLQRDVVNNGFVVFLRL